MPSGVPKAIVKTGTFAAAAASPPSAVGRPTVVSPSDSSTIAPGATSSSPPLSSPSSSPESASWVSSRVPETRASPIAVDSASSRLSIPRSKAARSKVGATSLVTTPLNEIKPTSMSGATWSTNSRAASLAASRRLGSTSVAIIDSDTSNSTTMRPSLSVRSVDRSIGRAIATTPAAKPASCSPATTCRRQPGRCGATRSSSSTDVNRSIVRRRQCRTAT